METGDVLLTDVTVNVNVLETSVILITDETVECHRLGNRRHTGPTDERRSLGNRRYILLMLRSQIKMGAARFNDFYSIGGFDDLADAGRF